MKLPLKSLVTALLFASCVSASLAQSLSFLGNTSLYLSGVGGLPTLGSYVEPNQTVSVTTQTYPISNGQSVNLIYTTDKWKTSHSIPLQYDKTVGNNTQWYAVLGPFPRSTDILFYLQAQTTNGLTAYDSNGGQNYGYITRYQNAIRRGAILQWFATPYSTILKRLPEVAKAGYSALYLPPPQKSGGGGFSVGYNPFDRFDLGDRLQVGTVATQYGTTEELQQVIKVAHRLGLEVYADIVTNHNDNRAGTAINLYPNVMPEDFHIHSSVDTTNSQIDFNNAPDLGFNVLNYDLSGLADIAHEDGNMVETGPFTLPPFASFNSNGKPSFVRNPLTPQYYPNGTPTTEDVREYLKRWGWWLANVIGFDGFRIDAVRHTDPGFFATVNTQGGFQVSRGDFLPSLYNLKPNLLVFGEDDNTDNYEQREYLKTGMELLDFPLFNAIGSVFNSNGYGSLGNSLGNSYGLDSATGATFELGGLATDLGVSFVQSHDYGPPTSNNLAYAFTLTRPGNSIVYFDGNNMKPGDYSQFPKPGRADALGDGDSILLNSVDTRARFGRGNAVVRYRSDTLMLIERQVGGQGILLTGLNLRGDSTSLTATCQTSFPAGTVLVDQTGIMPAVTVSASGYATITVPANGDSANDNNGTGYVFYAPRAPVAVGGVALQDAASGANLNPTTVATPAGTYGHAGSYQATTVTGNQLNLSLSVDASASSAFVQVDNGVAPGGVTLLSGTLEGLTDGFFPLNSSGNGNFNASNVDLSSLDDGLHELRFRAFLSNGSGPGVFSDFVTFILVKRNPLQGIDGTLTKYGQPLVTQTNTPSSQSNRLDEIFASNDDQYLYLGFAGTVDTSSNFTNGLVAFLDTSLGAGSGLTNFQNLNDDSGPAARLLSNGNVTAPSGFSAKFAISSFRQSILSSSPEAPFSGSATIAPPIGAQAGAFSINMNSLTAPTSISAKMAWLPRSSPFGAPTGLEVAIPLKSLFGSYVSAGAKIGIVGYVTTTGETGTTLDAHDPTRTTLGGRPASISYVTNQILPPQPGISSDPGNNPLALTKFSTYVLKSAPIAPTISLYVPQPSPSTGPVRSAVLVLKNTGSTCVSGPIYVSVSVPTGVSVTNATAMCLTSTHAWYFKLPGGPLAAGESRSVTVQYLCTSNLPFAARCLVELGPGLP